MSEKLETVEGLTDMISCMSSQFASGKVVAGLRSRNRAMRRVSSAAESIYRIRDVRIKNEGRRGQGHGSLRDCWRRQERSLSAEYRTIRQNKSSLSPDQRVATLPMDHQSRPHSSSSTHVVTP
jgi:hypothetical protein